MHTKSKGKGVRERLIATARDLFFRQGYRLTGVNQIIKEAGVSKASFYDHFPSKDDLCVAYLLDFTREEFDLLKAELRQHVDPFERYMTLIRILEPFSAQEEYRGCGFLNICVELEQSDHPVRKEAKYAVEGYRALVRDLVGDLKKSGGAYAGIDVEQVTDDYLLLVEGALALSRIYHDAWPLRRAAAAAERLVR